MSWVTNTTVTPYLLPHLEDQVLQVGAGLRVDRGERLVHQQDLGLVGQRAGDRHALLHAARELPRVAVEGAASGRPTRPRRSTRRSASSPRAACACAAGRRRSGARSSTGTASGCTPGRPAPSSPAARRRARRRARTSPRVGASSPDMHFSSVVLPQPEGPTMQTNSFSATSKLEVADRLDRVVALSVGLAEVIDLQHLFISPHSLARAPRCQRSTRRSISTKAPFST